MDKIRLISFDKEDYVYFYEKQIKGSLKWFLFAIALFNIILALPLHLLSGGKELKICEGISCNIFILCTAFCIAIFLIGTLGSYWSTINNLKGDYWGIPIVTIIAFFICFNLINTSWIETKIIISIFISLCATQVAIKCCK